MRTTTIFAVGLTAALMFAVVMSLPASAQPTYGNGFTLLSTTSATSGLFGPNSPTILLARGGRHGAFRGGFGFFGGYPYSYGYGPYYGGDGYGYYQEGTNTCVWTGYNYRCYNTYQDVY